MNILLSAYNCSPYSGSEAALGWNWVTALAMKGYCLHILTDIFNQKAIEKYISGDETDLLKNVKFVYVDFFRQPIRGHLGQILDYNLFQKKAYKTAKKLVKKVKFDYVHHVSWASIVQPSYLYKLNIPFIMGPGGGGERIPSCINLNLTLKESIWENIRILVQELSKYNPTNQQLYKKAFKIYASTEETKRLIPDKYKHKTIVKSHMTNALKYINCTNYVERQNTTPIILMSGRLIYWKGFELGIKAFTQLLENGTDAELYITGTGEQEAIFKKLAEKYINKKIFFMEAVPFSEMNKMYANSDIFLNCSLHDSGSTVIIEAMNNGLPIVCVDTGGPKVLTEDTYAIKVQPTKTNMLIDNLELALKELILNKEKRIQMGKEAMRVVAEKYSYDAVANEIYSKLESDNNE